MLFKCKTYWQHCVVYDRAKPDRRGVADLQPLGIPEYPWEIVGDDYVIGLPKSGSFGYTAVFVMVCFLTKTARFVPRRKEIMAEELADFFI
jgi:hypothetical protein